MNTYYVTIDIPMGILDLAQSLTGQVYVVGGAVRDFFMGREIKDWDLVVFDMDQDELEYQLGCKFVYKQVVGKEGQPAPPVYLVDAFGVQVELAMARGETKQAPGKHGFSYRVGYGVTLMDDAERRDFTVNALYYDIQTDIVLDPFGGVNDIKTRLLHPCSEKFVESPERILRAANMISRFDMTPSEVLYDYCAKIDISEIPAEQTWRHFEKIMAGDNWDNGLYFLSLTGHYPQFEKIEYYVPRFGGIMHRAARVCIYCGNNVLETMNYPETQREKVRQLAQEYQKDINPRQLAAILDKYGLMVYDYAVVWNNHNLEDRAKEMDVLYRAEAPWITGADLLNLSVKQGPIYKEILDYLYALQVTRTYGDRAALLEILLDVVNSLTSKEKVI